MRNTLLVAIPLAAVLAVHAGDTPSPQSPFNVVFSKKTITVTSPSGDKRAIAWKDLTQVAVRTSDEGPKKPAAFWELHGTDAAGTVGFPRGAMGENALIEAMQARLVGFDRKKLVQAMSSTTNQTFVLWEKKAP